MEDRDEKDFETLEEAALRLLETIEKRRPGRKNVKRLHVAANDEFGQPQWDEWE